MLRVTPAEKDHRLSCLTKAWCEELYPAKYGITYPWGGKEAKQLQRLLAYVGSNVGKDEAEGEVLALFRAYLADPKIDAEKHPFGWLCTKPQDWLAKKSQPKEAPSEEYVCRFCRTSGVISWAGLGYRCQCSNGDKACKKIAAAPAEAFAPRPGKLMDWLMEADDHEKLFRGFAQTHGILKLIRPDIYPEVRRFWLELFGEKEAKRRFFEAQKDSIFIAVGKQVRYAKGNEAQHTSQMETQGGVNPSGGGGPSGVPLEHDLEDGGGTEANIP